MQNALTSLRNVFDHITDLRRKKGRAHPLSAILTLTLLGLLAGQNYTEAG